MPLAVGDRKAGCGMLPQVLGPHAALCSRWVFEKFSFPVERRSFWRQDRSLIFDENVLKTPGCCRSRLRKAEPLAANGQTAPLIVIHPNFTLFFPKCQSIDIPKNRRQTPKYRFCQYFQGIFLLCKKHKKEAHLRVRLNIIIYCR